MKWSVRARGSAIAAALAASLAVSACGGSPHAVTSASTVAKPVTLTYWVFWTGSELDAIKQVVAGFEQSHPGITVNVVSGQGGDTKHLAPAIQAGDPPDLVGLYDLSGLLKLCNAGELTHLAAEEKASGINGSTYAAATERFLSQRVHDCAVPQLGDADGLYYNKSEFAAAGITSPPRTLSELTADAEKLTTYNQDGSIRVAGYVPLIGFYDNYDTSYASIDGSQWFDESGHANLASDPLWTELLTWQRGLIDAIGYDKLNRFAAEAGDSSSAQNVFETGKMAMLLDGEWETQSIASDNPQLDYGTAPFPVPDSEPSRYGATSASPGWMVIPAGSKQQAAAWELADYLSTNTGAQVQLANLLHNIPQTVAALKSPQLNLGSNMQPFLSGFANPGSMSAPALPSGADYAAPVNNFFEKWQADQVPVGDLQSSLVGVDHQIDANVAAAQP